MMLRVTSKKGNPMDIGWKVVSAGAGLAAGVVSNKLLDLTWRAVTGHRPPTDDDEGHAYSALEVIVFAAVSGAVVAVTRQLALQAADKWYGPAISKKK